MFHTAAWSRRLLSRDPWTIVRVFLASLLVFAAGLPARADDGSLQQMRDDVRNGSPANSNSHGDGSDVGSTILSGVLGGGGDSNDQGSTVDDSDESLFRFELLLGAVWLSGMAVTSPIWGPMGILQDDYSIAAHFPRFPYDDSPGYLTTDPYSTVTRPWAARLSTEYREPFEHIQIVGGRLLVSTTTRFGVDTQWDYLQEDLAGGGHDQLWTGDCNLVFRFAQNEHAEFRTGLGFNWLDDPQQTDFGFNFTYGFDFFPLRPWVLSTDIDWGTLGKAELFRFRSTVGAVIHGVEAYTGYEYFDVGRSHLNCLIGGLRIWF